MNDNYPPGMSETNDHGTRIYEEEPVKIIFNPLENENSYHAKAARVDEVHGL